jgi:hypothetical protein
LQNISAKAKAAIRTDLDDLILSKHSPFTFDRVDWQSVADMIVTHYSTRLKFLALQEVSKNSERLFLELSGILVAFIDYDNRSREDEVARCSTAYLPQTSKRSIAAETIAYVQHYICRNLFLAFNSCAFPQNSREDCVEGLAAPQLIDNLITRLEWTTWKECGLCGYDEICFIPIWPYGSVQDHQNPSCTNATAWVSKRGYWGIPGQGRRRPPPERDQGE